MDSILHLRKPYFIIYYEAYHSPHHIVAYQLLLIKLSHQSKQGPRISDGILRKMASTAS